MVFAALRVFASLFIPLAILSLWVGARLTAVVKLQRYRVREKRTLVEFTGYVTGVRVYWVVTWLLTNKVTVFWTKVQFVVGLGIVTVPVEQSVINA